MFWEFLCNKTNKMHQFHKFILSWNSTCFGQFVFPSSGVYSLYTQQWYMSYRFVDSFRAGQHPARKLSIWHTPLLSVRWINSWWWTEELSKTCRVSWQHKFVKLVHLVGFITKKFVTMQVICHDARSHATMHGHMPRCTVTCYDARSHVTMHGHMNVKMFCEAKMTGIYSIWNNK